MTTRALCPRLLPHPGSARRRGLGCDRSALAALEFALMAPILSTLFIGSVDAAQVYMSELRLTSAVYSGANYAIVNQASVTSAGGAGAKLASLIATIVGNVNGSGWASGTVVVNNGPTVTFSGGTNTGSGTATAANADSYYCLTGSPGAWNWGVAQASNAVSCGLNQPTAGKFVTITASYAITPIILGLNFGDGKISQSIAVQVQ
jgi:Flp pilus assembly protein TadG